MKDIPHGLVLGKVIDRVEWNEQLFTLYVRASVPPYVAGQFTKLALFDGEEIVRRAYSMVNASQNNGAEADLEFLVIKDEQGQLSPKLHALNIGDDIYVGNTPSGYMTLLEVPDHVDDLWMLSTGTAVGPFLAILEELTCSQRFNNLVLVHAVRQEKDLTYAERIQQQINHFKGKLKYVPIVSRELVAGTVRGRIPDLLLNGELQRAAKLDFNQERSFVFLCGNPGMVRDTSESLKALGLSKHLRKKSGQFSSENYW